MNKPDESQQNKSKISPMKGDYVSLACREGLASHPCISHTCLRVMAFPHVCSWKNNNVYLCRWNMAFSMHFAAERMEGGQRTNKTEAFLKGGHLSVHISAIELANSFAGSFQHQEITRFPEKQYHLLALQIKHSLLKKDRWTAQSVDIFSTESSLQTFFVPKETSCMDLPLQRQPSENGEFRIQISENRWISHRAQTRFTSAAFQGILPACWHWFS